MNFTMKKGENRDSKKKVLMKIKNKLEKHSLGATDMLYTRADTKISDYSRSLP